ncbi:HAD family hydrolase [Promicromonospora sukumoe]|uniref:HAD family hydrolase n=1 Tax=Promicromonospora sukumoe TaxID=88382 RepID=UPI00364FA42D
MTDTSAAGAPSAPSALAVSAPSALAVRPEALLLDFGGVIFQTRKRPEEWPGAAAYVAEHLARAGHRFAAEDLETVLRGGNTALKSWKNAQSRRLEPTELTHREIWRDFYGSPLPEAAREVLAGSAGLLQHHLTATLAEHTVRPGIPELLDLARDLGVPLGIVSNAHSGRAHRALLDEHGLGDAFAVQVYSDEVGIRKPHPGMIELAAAALGTTPGRCWYVGDTYDRDVVAGRRAGVGAVVLTRHHHTDNPPFPVAERADAVLDTPEGLVELLRSAEPMAPSSAPPVAPSSAPSLTGPENGPAPTSPSRPKFLGFGPAQSQETSVSKERLPSALLLDHGGVLHVSVPDDAVRHAFAAGLADRLTRAGYPLTADQVTDALPEVRAAHKDWKNRSEAVAAAAATAKVASAADADAVADADAAPRAVADADAAAQTVADADAAGADVPEIDARTFWTQLALDPLARRVGGAVAGDPSGLRAWLHAEAHDLMARYARAKSVPTLRPGVRDLLEAAHAHGVPVAVVSNTVNGRAVREELDADGIGHLVGAHVYSDELGHRKPDRLMPATALRALGADPATAVFVGDKPRRDVLAARAAGVGITVLVRGGSTPDDVLDALHADVGHPARPDHVIDQMGDLLGLVLPAAPSAPSAVGPSAP